MTTKYRRIGNKINRLSSSKNSNLSLVAMFNGFHVAADALHGSAGVGDCGYAIPEKDIWRNKVKQRQEKAEETSVVC